MKATTGEPYESSALQTCRHPACQPRQSLQPHQLRLGTRRSAVTETRSEIWLANGIQAGLPSTSDRAYSFLALVSFRFVSGFESSHNSMPSQGNRCPRIVASAVKFRLTPLGVLLLLGSSRPHLRPPALGKVRWSQHASVKYRYSVRISRKRHDGRRLSSFIPLPSVFY